MHSVPLWRTVSSLMCAILARLVFSCQGATLPVNGCVLVAHRRQRVPSTSTCTARARGRLPGTIEEFAPSA